MTHQSFTAVRYRYDGRRGSPSFGIGDHGRITAAVQAEVATGGVAIASVAVQVVIANPVVEQWGIMERLEVETNVV